jgi:DNA invertase Pin-like site-specific DNA recombinase
MRAAIYARYSTDLQSTSAIEDQNRLCPERGRERGWAVTVFDPYERRVHRAALLQSGHGRRRTGLPVILLAEG